MAASAADFRSQKDWVNYALSPLVAVVASPDVEALCLLNNIPSFVDLVKPFGQRIWGKMPIRDVQGQTVTVDNYYLRFADLSRLEGLGNGSAINKVGHSIMKEYAAKHIPPLDLTQLDTEQITLDDATPWYTEWKSSLCQLLGASEHETFNHPVACIIAVSTRNPDILGTLAKQYNPNLLPPIFNKGYVDANVLRHYLLVHDVASNPTMDVNTILLDMKKTFGVSCSLLKLNSLQTPLNRPAVPDIWTPYLLEMDKLVKRLAVETPSSSVHSSLENVNLIPISPDQDPQSQQQQSQQQQQQQFPLPDFRGQHISKDDFQGIETFFKDFLTQHLLPYMERNVQIWNEQVASSRRGITGRLFSAGRKYFGSGGGSKNSANFVENTDGTGLVIYSHSAPEAMMRKLADYAFMLRDYRFAYSVYDNVKKDFQSTEKANKYLAGTLEMMGLCTLFASDVSASKLSVVETGLETAVLNYNESKTPWLSTRAALFYYELLSTLDILPSSQFIPNLILRATSDELDVRNAIMVEQAAFTFLRLRVPNISSSSSSSSSPGAPSPMKRMLKKYAFHCILAGHRYNKCGQREHAYRCYLAASKLYQPISLNSPTTIGSSNSSNKLTTTTTPRWTLAEDHIYFTLARQSFHLGDVNGALEFFMNVMRLSKQPGSVQAAYLKEFSYIFQQRPLSPSQKTLPLPIPVIPDSGIRVALLNSSFSPEHSSHVQSHGDEEIWDSMEKDLVDEGFNGSLAPGMKRILVRHDAAGKGSGRTIAAVGEPVFVYMELGNPMMVELELSDLFLEAVFYDSSTVAAATATTTSTSTTNTYATHWPNVELKGILTPGQGFDRIVYPEFDVECIRTFLLGANERMAVQLRIFPKREGCIHILGLRYTLNKHAPGYKSFQKRGKRLNDTKDHYLTPTYANDLTCQLVVTPPIPALDVVFHYFPDRLFSGEVVKCVLEVNNKGNFGLKNLKVKVSHPNFVAFGKGQSGEEDVYVTNAAAASETIVMSNKLQNHSVFNIDLPDGHLSPGMTALIPLWVRGDRIGKYAFRFLFGYQSEDANDKIAYRTLQYKVHTEVMGSLRINAFTRSSTRLLNEFVLGFEIENLVPGDHTVVIRQISSISPSWMIVPNDENAGHKGLQLELLPQQTQFSYFRFRRNPDRTPSATALEESPEMVSNAAIEKLLVGDGKGVSIPAKPVTLGVASVASPHTDFVTMTLGGSLHRLSMASKHQARQTSLTNQYPILTAQQVRDLFPLFMTDDVDLVLYYSIPSLNKTGHFYVTGMHIGFQTALQLQLSKRVLDASKTSKILYAQTVREKKALITSLLKTKTLKDVSPVRVVLECADILRHGFVSLSSSRQSPLVVDVKVFVKNISWTNKADFFLEMLPPAENSTSGNNYKNGTESALVGANWIGSTYCFGLLEPDQKMEFVLRLSFTKPGVYDINRYKLTSSYYEDPNTVVKAPVVTTTKSGKSKVGAIATNPNVNNNNNAATKQTPASTIPSWQTGGPYVQTPTVSHLVTVMDKHAYDDLI